MQTLNATLKESTIGDLDKIIRAIVLFNLTNIDKEKSGCIVLPICKIKSSYDVCTICIHKVCVENSLRTTISCFANSEEQSKSDLVKPRNTNTHCKNTASNLLQFPVYSGVVNLFAELKRNHNRRLLHCNL
jgi:hypothetical protein